ncbi:membrane protein [Salinispora tropica]|nr:membrane protein [Salinispora tropica]
MAGMTGLAFTTAAVATAAYAQPNQPAPSFTTATDTDLRDRATESGRNGGGTPVACDADALIAAITSANATGGGVFDLAKDCTYLLTFDIGGAGLPAVTAPITLNGGKNTTIERAAAADQFRILTVGTGGNLTLNHLKITGGQTTAAGTDGGGILVNTGGGLAVNHSAVTSNIAGGNGGGIANNGVTTVKRSTVSRNTARLEGGGIYSTGALTVGRSEVEANTGTAGGGGIASMGGTVEVAKSSLSGNWSNQGAGLFIVDSGIGSVTDTHITKNSAADVGGGVFILGQLTMQKVVLAGNTAETGAGLSVVNGSTADIMDSAIVDNTAGAQGGGIFNAGMTTLNNTKLDGNQADMGGGVQNLAAATLTFFASTVTDNLAVTDGGGIFNEVGGTVTLNTATGTTVIGNRPNNCVNVPGCAG